MPVMRPFWQDQGERVVGASKTAIEQIVAQLLRLPPSQWEKARGESDQRIGLEASAGESAANAGDDVSPEAPHRSAG